MNLYIIVNPVSGHKNGVKLLEIVLPIFGNAGFSNDSIISEHARHPYEITNALDLKKYDVIAIIGGDGTMHEVINGMMDRQDKVKIPIGLITAGTGNALMHDLDALDPIKATQNIIEGKKLKIDIAKIMMEDRHLYSFNIVGWGLPVTVNHMAEKWRFIGSQRYNASSLMGIVKNPEWKVAINFDDEKMEGKYSFFLACNTIHSGNAMKMAPKAKMNDGKFDLLILKKASRYKLVRLFMKIFKGNHIHDDMVTYKQVKSFGISNTIDSILIVDGQAVGQVPFEAKVLKQAIEIFV